MSEFSGTPGPWSHDEYGNVVHGAKDGFGRMEKVRVSGVALPGRVTQEYAANTRLVVAAPEILEALQAAMAWIDAVPQDVQLPAMPGFERDWVDGIINKALGR